MKKFETHTGLVAPLYRANIDTDQIVPKNFLLSVSRTGFSDALFYEWRYDADGKPFPDFVLNDPNFHGASILLTGENFGCGSSREHAPWALDEFGFRTIIAPSFADIFYNNCFKTGILPIVLDPLTIEALVTKANNGNYSLTVNLEKQTLSDEYNFESPFEIDPFRKYLLLNGLDDIGLTLIHEPEIAKFELASTK